MSIGLRSSLFMGFLLAGTIAGSCVQAAPALAAFADGTPVTLTATAASGSTFDGWSGAGCSGTGTCTIAATQVRDVSAAFAVQPPAPEPEPEPDPGPAPSPQPSNEFTVTGTSVKVSRRAIEVAQRVTVPGPGLAGLRLRSTRDGLTRNRCAFWRETSKAGSYSLRCRLGESYRRRLRSSSLKVTLVNSFEPQGGTEATQSRSITLKRRR